MFKRKPIVLVRFYRGKPETEKENKRIGKYVRKNMKGYNVIVIFEDINEQMPTCTIERVV